MINIEHGEMQTPTFPSRVIIQSSKTKEESGKYRGTSVTKYKPKKIIFTSPQVGIDPGTVWLLWCGHMVVLSFLAEEVITQDRILQYMET